MTSGNGDLVKAGSSFFVLGWLSGDEGYTLDLMKLSAVHLGLLAIFGGTAAFLLTRKKSEDVVSGPHGHHGGHGHHGHHGRHGGGFGWGSVYGGSSDDFGLPIVLAGSDWCVDLQGRIVRCYPQRFSVMGSVMRQIHKPPSPNMGVERARPPGPPNTPPSLRAPGGATGEWSQTVPAQEYVPPHVPRKTHPMIQHGARRPYRYPA